MRATTLLRRLVDVTATRVTGVDQGESHRIERVAGQALDVEAAKRRLPNSADALIAMLFLNSGGIELSPRLPRPTPC